MSFFAELKRRNVVRVAAAYLVISWLLLQVADVLFEALAVPEWATKLLIAFLVLGLFPALIFSWVYELTPEGVKRETEVPQDASITHHTGRKLDYITLGALVLVTGLFFADRFIGLGGGPDASVQKGPGTDHPSVAVLPFVNMSGNAENEYFSDGLTETLLHMLAQVPDLKVAARTSSFAFKGKDSDIREIASQLGVNTVLEGSVQRSGDRVRITAQLIDSTDGTHLWSDNFDRTLDDIFVIQDEIATEVVRALSATLLDEQPDALVGVATENLDAYDLYLQGLTQRAIGSYGSLSEAAGLFKDALAQDPDFHDAKLELARTYIDQIQTGAIEDEDGWTRAEALVGQVLADRPDDPNAEGILVIIGGMRALDAGDFAGFTGMIEPLTDIVERLPNEPMFRGWLAALLDSQGETEAAIAMTRGTLEIDPLNARSHQTLADRLSSDDRFEEAEEVLHRALELAPEAPNIYSRLARVNLSQGRLAEAVDWYIQAAEVDPQDHELPSEIAQWLYLIGLPEEGDEFRRRAEAIAPSEGLVRSLLPLRAWAAGEDDEALELARELIDDDIDTRQGAWPDTLRLYLYLMADQGRNREAVDYVEARYPGSTAYGEPPQSIKVMLARFNLLPPLSSLIEDHAGLAARTEALYAVIDEAGFDWRDQPQQYLWYAYFTGDLETARIKALEHLERPVARNLDWRFTYTHPAMAELAADPAIRTHLDEYQREEIRLREEVREMLAERAKRT